MTYVVFQTGGKQYRVSSGDCIDVERLDVEVGSKVVFDTVFLIAEGEEIVIGAPSVEDASVVAHVIRHYQGPKVVAYKFKRRKGYHRTIGHRRQLTRLEIVETKGNYGT